MVNLTKSSELFTSRIGSIPPGSLIVLGLGEGEDPIPVGLGLRATARTIAQVKRRDPRLRDGVEGLRSRLEISWEVNA